MPTYRASNPIIESICAFFDHGSTGALITIPQALIFAEVVLWTETLVFFYLALAKGNIPMAFSSFGGGVALFLISYSRIKMNPELRMATEV
ncbi:hypothetical protein V8F33_013152 [Rhypophila sp. PSN 637]